MVLGQCLIHGRGEDLGDVALEAKAHGRVGIVFGGALVDDHVGNPALSDKQRNVGRGIDGEGGAEGYREAGGGSGMRGLFRRRRPRPEDQPAEEPAADTPAAERARRELERTLENKEAKPDEIKARLTALREAREKAKEELAKAKDSLREILTQRQEAQLVLYGILD